MNTDAFVKAGTFSVAPEREVYGELRVAGRDTSLYLRDDKEIGPNLAPGGCITGTLHDLRKITLLGCVTLDSGSGSSGPARYYYARLFPHYVLEGRRFLHPQDSAIVETTLALEDATALFYDFDAFGTVIEPAPHIAALVAANKLDRSVPIGPEPRIAYFTGKRDITVVDTVLGKVRARHNPDWSFGGPHGVRIDNTMSVGIETDPPVAFDEAISRILRLLRFLELIIGRPQNLRGAAVCLSGGEHREPLRVHWSLGPHRDADWADGTANPQPPDLPLDPINRPEEFASVLVTCLAHDRKREDARERFHGSFAQQRRYSVERLVGAANMFDILPESAVPRDVELSEEMRKAKEDCRAVFKALPKSYERDSVLNALGRVGKASLKHKTRHRAQYVLNAVGQWLPDLVLVLDEAVQCRNHYVHGSAATFD